MEYMDCGSIETMISVEKEFYDPNENRSLIPEPVISRMAWHILQGLMYLHEEKKQIHRDVKPDNILLESNFGFAKISDFGISKKLIED